MKAIFLKPLDTFFFKDHRGLTAGEDTAAAGLFPPRSGTIYGALRSAYIHKHSDFDTFKMGTDTVLKEWMGTPNNVGNFSFRGMFVHNGDELLLPLPLDYQVIVHEGDTQELAYSLLLQESSEQKQWSSDKLDWKLYGKYKKKSRSATNAYVPLSVWKKALIQFKDGFKIQRPSEWMAYEPKTGISIDRMTRTAREKMLYQVEMQRFQQPKYSLCVLCDQSPDFSDISLATCGHGNKIWQVSEDKEFSSILTDEEKELIVEEINKTGIARIILLTPAIWGLGSRPKMLRNNKLIFDAAQTGCSYSFDVEVLTSVVGRPQIIGGWDMAKVRPKPRMYAVPAGTVLYVRVQPSITEKLVFCLDKFALTDKLPHEGYGYAVCGYYRV